MKILDKKPWSLLLFLLAACTFSACSDDDEPGGNGDNLPLYYDYDDGVTDDGNVVVYKRTVDLDEYGNIVGEASTASVKSTEGVEASGTVQIFYSLLYVEWWRFDGSLRLSRLTEHGGWIFIPDEEEAAYIYDKLSATSDSTKTYSYNGGRFITIVCPFLTDNPPTKGDIIDKLPEPNDTSGDGDDDDSSTGIGGAGADNLATWFDWSGVGYGAEQHGEYYTWREDFPSGYGEIGPDVMLCFQFNSAGVMTTALGVETFPSEAIAYLMYQDYVEEDWEDDTFEIAWRGNSLYLVERYVESDPEYGYWTRETLWGHISAPGYSYIS